VSPHGAPAGILPAAAVVFSPFSPRAGFSLEDDAHFPSTSIPLRILQGRLLCGHRLHHFTRTHFFPNPHVTLACTVLSATSVI